MATTVVEGSPDIQDTYTYSSTTNSNFGGSSELHGDIDFNNILLRVITSAIPSEENTAVSLRLYHKQWRAGHTISAYPMTNASTWVQGTANGATQTGSVCWRQMGYNTAWWPSFRTDSGGRYSPDDRENTWMGSASGFDLNTWYTWNLTASIFNAFKSGGRTNNGIILFPTSGGNTCIFASTNGGLSTSPEFEFTYPDPITGTSFFFFGLGG